MRAEPLIAVTRHNDITFHSNGRIDLTAHVSRVLGIMPGDVINIASDDSSFPELYLYVARRADDTLGRHSCRCRPAKSNGRYLRFFSKRLATLILDATQSTERVSLRVGASTIVPGLGLALPIIIPHPPIPISSNQ